IKQIAPAIGGGGGGRPDMAQAGGKNPEGIQTAFADASTWLAEK
ncbi:DHHA1 domain-containing protein, partial [Weissella viridescens]